MQPFTKLLILSVWVICPSGVGAFGQKAPTPTANPCSVNPDAPKAGKSLSDQLDDCNGVLAPPKVGDSEIVEPAPDVGTMRVIPPGALRSQQSDAVAPESMPAPTRSNADYDAAEIVKAIGNAGSVADSLATLKPSHVDVRDISILLRGSNLAVLNASLAEHASDLDALRASITQSPILAAAVAQKGLKIVGIVGATIGEDRSVTLFGR